MYVRTGSRNRHGLVTQTRVQKLTDLTSVVFLKRVNNKGNS